MKKKHIIISIIAHCFLILFLIYFSWTPTKKMEDIQAIEMINIESPNISQKIPEKKNLPEATIPELKEKDNIVVPKKKIIKKRKIIKRPKPKTLIKPLPKIESALENKLKKLDSEVPNPKEKKEIIQDKPTSKKKLLIPEVLAN